MKAVFKALLLFVMSGMIMASELPWQGFQQIGNARLSVLFWRVYDARLYSPTPEFSFPGTRPFALELEYRRNFSRQNLVDETRRQWQAQGLDYREAWLEQLAVLLPDVIEQDRITLFVDAAGRSVFFLNDEELGVIGDQEFSMAFARIWLAEQTAHPDFRKALLGEP